MSRINRTVLRQLHAAFEQRMFEKSGGIPFTGFGHPFFLEDEVDYKQMVRIRAGDVLELSKWTRKSVGSGLIRDRLRTACGPSISKNLLEHRFGVEKGTAAPLPCEQK